MKYKEFLGKKVKVTFTNKQSHMGYLFYGIKCSGFARRYILVPTDLFVCTVIFTNKVIEDIKLYDDRA